MSIIEIIFATILGCIAVFLLVEAFKSTRRIDVIMSFSLCAVLGLAAVVLFGANIIAHQKESTQDVNTECVAPKR